MNEQHYERELITIMFYFFIFLCTVFYCILVVLNYFDVFIIQSKWNLNLRIYANSPIYLNLRLIEFQHNILSSFNKPNYSVLTDMFSKSTKRHGVLSDSAGIIKWRVLDLVVIIRTERLGCPSHAGAPEREVACDYKLTGLQRMILILLPAECLTT